MADHKDFSPDFTDLRQRAEALLKDKSLPPEDLSPIQAARLIHELQVYQVELEMQNDELRVSHARLEESRCKYVDLYDFAPVGYLTLDNLSSIVEANLTAAALLGEERQHLAGRFFTGFLVESSRQAFRQLLASQDQRQRGEFQLINGHGVVRVMLLDVHSLEDAEGRERRCVAMTDISELKRIQEELRESEQNYRMVADFTYDWELWFYTDGTLRYSSPSCERITGHTAAAFLQDPDLFRDIIIPEDKDFWDSHMCDVRGKLEPREFQYRIRRADGAVRWIEQSCQPVTGDSGEFLGVRASNRDITARKEAELKLEEALANVERLKAQIEADYTYLQEEIKFELGFDQIVGDSQELKEVLLSVQKVAPSDTTVLILGETGTGKELIARALHSASPRAHRPLVKVDCATLSPTLIESELFGHEKGAFTGALTRKLGRFELADGGTLFLDEIGELAPPLQAKLLRIIQDGEFERLGSVRTLKVDVRIIAATNRDLMEEVRQGTFREDLWYRLHIFPITLPPLRHRREDIPLLAKFFLSRIAKKLGKDIQKIPSKVMKALVHYPWPGNVRELENVIERAAINTQGPILQLAGEIPAAPAAAAPDAASPGPAGQSLADRERDHILQALQETGWRIEGKNGAAAKLGLNPSTLRGRLRKYGITRQNPS